jgi:hypothetical protein
MELSTLAGTRVMRAIGAVAASVAALAVASTASVAAMQGGATHVLIVTGLSAEPRFAKAFGSAASSIYDAARTQWHVADSDLVYLAEDPAIDPKRMSGKATRESVGQAFATLARRAHPGDVVLIFLLGHGSGEMAASSVNLPGPDPTAADYAQWLVPLSRASVIFVNASSASGDFVPLLAAPNRVVVTATKTAVERNESIFGGYFAAGLTGQAADANKDGRVSVVEAFNYARGEVSKVYESSNRMLTEHAILADTSGLASRIAFGGESASTDPRVMALVGERRVLEAQVDSLRRVKPTMDSTAYESQLERLLLQIAAKTAAIRVLQPGGKP